MLYVCARPTVTGTCSNVHDGSEQACESNDIDVNEKIEEGTDKSCGEGAGARVATSGHGQEGIISWENGQELLVGKGAGKNRLRPLDLGKAARVSKR